MSITAGQLWSFLDHMRSDAHNVGNDMAFQEMTVFVHVKHGDDVHRGELTGVTQSFTRKGNGLCIDVVGGGER